MKKGSCSCVLSVLLVLLTAFHVVPSVFSPTATKDLLIKIFSDPTTENWALERDEIDINDWPLSKDFIDRWAATPDKITLNEYAEIGKMQFDMNNQLWPTGGPNPAVRTGARNEYFDISDPTQELCRRHYAAWFFRRAIAHLTNKPKYITEYLKGQGYAMYTEVPIPALQGYINYGGGFGGLANITETKTYYRGGIPYTYSTDYKYVYSRLKARQALAAGGFDDWVGNDGLLEWKDIGPDLISGTADDGAIEALPTIKLFVRTDDPNRKAAGMDLAYEMDAVGIKTSLFPSVPLDNMNFTDTTSTKWITTADVISGTAGYGYDSSNGNPQGSGAPSYYLRANSTSQAKASIEFTTEQSFYWNQAPVRVQFSYAIKISGNSIGGGGKLTIQVIMPNGRTKPLMRKPITREEYWRYTIDITDSDAFKQKGVYKFQLISELKTADKGSENYVQVNWDDVGLKIYPAGPLVVIVTERSACFDAVMVAYDYNIYTGDWSLSADLDFIHDLYASETGQYAWAQNYPGFKNEEFDIYADRVKYPATAYDVLPAALDAQWVKAKYQPVVELWAAKGVKAYRTGWQGAVNFDGYGTDNAWSFHEMDWTGPAPDRYVIRYGFKNDISALSVLYSAGRSDWKVLGLLYDSLLARNPYNLGEEVGMLATEWSIGSWAGPSGPATVCNFTLRDNAYFTDGSQIKPADVAFSLLMPRDAGAGVAWNYPTAMDIDHVNINGQKISVYFGVQSFWALHWAGFMPIMNKDLWFDAIGVPEVYIKQYDRNSTGFILGNGGYPYFIPDDTPGTYSGGKFNTDPPLRARYYRPWTDTRGGAAGVIDLQEDCSYMWQFVSYTIGQTVLLTRNTLYYTTSTSGITWKGHYDWICPVESIPVGIKCRPYLMPTPPCYKMITIGRFIHEAFHEKGNVNYPGAYGTHTHTNWYSADKIIDSDDLDRITASMPSMTGTDTRLWPEFNWGNGSSPPQYNIDADISSDQTVDVEDLSLAAVNFMKKEG